MNNKLSSLLYIYQDTLYCFLKQMEECKHISPGMSFSGN
jgi:hypothetical protein